MSLFLIKSILSTFFFLSGLIALLCMFILMGKTERKISSNLLRKLHKSSGFVFTALLFVISYICIKYWAMAGDQLSTRADLHAVLALALFIVFLLKILIVRFFKQFLKFVPVMGMTVFALSFIVFCTSAGFFFLRSLSAKSETPEISIPSQVKLQGNIEKGAALFKSLCSSCHHADKEERKLGPGLKNILKKEKLPSSGKPVNIENIRRQLRTPFLTMPSFKSLSDRELADLLAYLEIL